MKLFTNQHRHAPAKKRRNIKIIIGLSVVAIGTVSGMWFFHNHQVQVTKNHPVIKKDYDCKPLQLDNDVSTAIVIDAHTGQILAEKNSHLMVGIASQSKMLTSYETLRQIKSGKIHWNDKVQINEQNDWSEKNTNTYSHLDMKKGDLVSVHDLFDAMYTNSANDAALALADYIKPKKMTQAEALRMWAKKLNLKESRWYNAAGQANSDAFAYKLSNESDDAENTATVRQLAFLALKNLQLDPALRQYYKEKVFTYKVNDIVKTKRSEYDRLSSGVFPSIANPLGLTFEGLKTGSTPHSGGAFTGLIKDKNGHEYITVVSGAGSYTSQNCRYENTISAVNKVIQNQELKKVNKKTKLKDIKYIGDVHQKDPKKVWVKKFILNKKPFDI